MSTTEFDFDTIFFEAVDEVARRYKAGEDRTEVAKALVRKMPARLRDYLAVRALCAEVRSEVRTPTRSAERAAAASPDGIKHGSVDKRNGGVLKGCACELCVTVRNQETESRSRFYNQVAGIVEDYTRNLRIQWTTELLESPFARPDGTPVTWGEATVEDHEARIKMHSDHAIAGLEGAARHSAALRDMRAAGVSSLNELVALQPAKSAA